MIKFPCKCGQILEVTDDQAGLTVQCPKCGLLRDVPTLSDLEHLTDFGTYLVDPPVPETEQQRLEKLREAFSRDRLDDQGDEIDLRPTIEDVIRSGYIEKPQDDSTPELPKYDPVTGELVEPIKIADDRPVQRDTIPMARRVVSYAAGRQQAVPQSSWRIFLQLFQPINMVVIIFVLIAHAVWEGILIICSMPFFFIFLPVLFFITGMFLAHYAIVIEETGPEERDELPRPLRHLELGADLWWPFVHFAGAFLLSYWPALVILAELIADSVSKANGGNGYQPEFFPQLMHWPVFFILLALGTVFFPAVLLTLTTSGSQLNLRPDRLIGVMIQCGMRYVWAVWMFPVIALIYMTGALGGHAVILRNAVAKPDAKTWLTTPAIVYPMLAIGVYLMHYFCWYLGLMYRDFHDRFPWVLQQHISTQFLERSTPQVRSD